MTPDQIGGAVLLFLLMWIVGMELTVADFRRVFATPRSVVGGTIAQLILLPAMTWVLCLVLGTPPVIAAGAVLVAAAPGAGMSNIMAALAGANTALSVSLTAMASVLAVLTLPVLAAGAVETFGAGSTDVEVPVGPLMVQLAVTLLIPIALGMWVRARFPDFVKNNAGRLQRGLFGLMVLFVGAAVALNEEAELPIGNAPEALLLAGLWTLSGMGIGYGMALLLRLPPADRLTYLIEFSARNIAVSSIVALSGLARADLALFSGAYGAVGYPMVIVATLIGRRMLQGIRDRDRDAALA